MLRLYCNLRGPPEYIWCMYVVQDYISFCRFAFICVSLIHYLALYSEEGLIYVFKMRLPLATDSFLKS